MAVWPELRNATRQVAQQQAILERAARKRKIIRERGEVQEPIVEEEPHFEMAMAAAGPYNMEVWQPWLREVYKLCDLHIPEMPLLKHHITDRLQLPKRRRKCNNMPWNCCVARPVFKDEVRRQPGAQAALRKEWDRLRAINTWLEDGVEEWDVVKARAKRQSVKIHVGMVFQICVGEDSETEKEEWLREYKGHVVFRGNDVVDENWDDAMLQELGSAPATMVAAKFCDLSSLLRNHVNENADATQACTQSLLGGTETWVSLPREEWPESWKHMRRPVCLFVKALYGHLTRGTMKDCGFGPVAPADRAWRSCCFSPSLKCYMIVYVDDFKISGPREGVKEAWRLIRGENPHTKERDVVLDEPTPAGKFLGCNHECSYV
jgi:hypothetical protein